MSIRVHTVDDPLVTSTESRPSRRRLTVRQLGEDLAAMVRHSLIALGPLSPRSTVAMRASPPVSRPEPGMNPAVTLTVRNLQPSLVVVSPALRRLRADDGTEWSPRHRIEVDRRLLPPGASTDVRIEIEFDPVIAPGAYLGSVVFLGSLGSIPLRVAVDDWRVD